MRIVFMGTPEFAVPSLNQLIQDGHNIVGVYPHPDKPKNRGMKLQPTPVKVCAQAHGIQVFQPEKLRDGAGELADGLKELNEEGIQKLVDAFDGDLELLSDRLRAARDVSRSYQGFTTSSSDGVKFIFRTEAIETEE